MAVGFGDIEGGAVYLFNYFYMLLLRKNRFENRLKNNKKGIKLHLII